MPSCRRQRLRRRCSALQQLVKLAAVQPNTPASRAIVNLNTLPIGHDEGGIRAVGAFHAGLSLFGLEGLRLGDHWSHAWQRQKGGVGGRQRQCHGLGTTGQSQRMAEQWRGPMSRQGRTGRLGTACSLVYQRLRGTQSWLAWTGLQGVKGVPTIDAKAILKKQTISLQYSSIIEVSGKAFGDACYGLCARCLERRRLSLA